MRIMQIHLMTALVIIKAILATCSFYGISFSVQVLSRASSLKAMALLFINKKNGMHNSYGQFLSLKLKEVNYRNTDQGLVMISRNMKLYIKKVKKKNFQ